MSGLLQLFILLLLYGSMFAVPVSLAGNRRKLKRPIYWWLLLLSVILECAVVFVLLSFQSAIKPTWIILYFSPILGATLSGTFYYYFSKKWDKK